MGAAELAKLTEWLAEEVVARTTIRSSSRVALRTKWRSPMAELFESSVEPSLIMVKPPAPCRA